MHMLYPPALVFILLPPSPLLRLFPLLVLQHAQRIPGGHDQIQYHPKHSRRHTLALRPVSNPKKEPHHAAELGSFLLSFIMAARYRNQCHARQRLTSRHTALQVGRHCGVAIGGDDDAAGLEKERGLLGVRGLFEDGDDGVAGLISLLMQSQGRLSVGISPGEIGAALEEEGHEGCLVCFSTTSRAAGMVERCAAMVTL